MLEIIVRAVSNLKFLMMALRKLVLNIGVRLEMQITGMPFWVQVKYQLQNLMCCIMICRQDIKP